AAPALHSGVKADKREMGLIASQHRSRQVEATRIPLPRDPLHRRATREVETQQVLRLVERFAKRVIDGRTWALVWADAAHDQELRMPAGNQKKQIRWGYAFGETHCERVRLKVVHRDERQTTRPRR